MAFASGGVVRQPSFAVIGENQGRHEAVVPLPDNRSIPVSFTNGGQRSEPAPIIINMSQDFSGTIDPRALRTQPSEIIAVVAKDIHQDGTLRRVIVNHGR